MQIDKILALFFVSPFAFASLSKVMSFGFSKSNGFKAIEFLSNASEYENKIKDITKMWLGQDILINYRKQSVF